MIAGVSRFSREFPPRSRGDFYRALRRSESARSNSGGTPLPLLEGRGSTSRRAARPAMSVAGKSAHRGHYGDSRGDGRTQGQRNWNARPRRLGRRVRRYRNQSALYDQDGGRLGGRLHRARGSARHIVADRLDAGDHHLGQICRGDHARGQRRRGRDSRAHVIARHQARAPSLRHRRRHARRGLAVWGRSHHAGDIGAERLGGPKNPGAGDRALCRLSVRRGSHRPVQLAIAGNGADLPNLRPGHDAVVSHHRRLGPREHLAPSRRALGARSARGIDLRDDARNGRISDARRGVSLRHGRRGALCRHGSFRPPADSPRVVRARPAGLAAELRRPNRAPGGRLRSRARQIHFSIFVRRRCNFRWSRWRRSRPLSRASRSSPAPFR